jgi:hypothetical protein
VQRQAQIITVTEQMFHGIMHVRFELRPWPYEIGLISQLRQAMPNGHILIAFGLSGRKLLISNTIFSGRCLRRKASAPRITLGSNPSTSILIVRTFAH